MKRLAWIVLTLITACGSGADMLNHKGVCDDFPAYATSQYILPYDVGQSYEVTQKSCGGFSHTGSYRYSYDFGMEIGEAVHASRSGTVTEIKEDVKDGAYPDNHIYIQHSDGTLATYLHLTENGALVDKGEQVTQGQKIGLSGDTGRSTGPHLHFSVYENEDQTTSIPISFSNTSAQILGLEAGTSYVAGDFTPDEFE